MKKLYFLIALFGISLSATQAQTTYKDVAPIFYSKCTMCHNAKGIAPMPLMNYSETYAYRGFIKTYVAGGIMPPWPPDTAYHSFFGQRVLSAYQKTMIINWIDSGAVAGDTTKAPIPPVYTNDYQLHGTPDLVVKIPPFVSNASTTDAYDCFVVPTGLTQDRIIRAFEIIPGNAAIVHHALFSEDTSGTATSDLSGNCYTMPGSNVGIGGYAPGCGPVVYPGRAPLKLGFRLKAHSNIVFQIHYPAGTAGQTDSTYVRIFFYPTSTTGIREIYTSTLLQNWLFSIPANTVKQVSAVYPSSGGLPADVSLYAAFPHQHKVGVNLVNYAYMGTDTIPLVRINNWDFRWQGYYIYNNLVHVPAGYKLYSMHTYDNTTANPNNPFSPPQNINAGVATTNEMLFDSYQYLPYQPGDDTINIDAILAGDTLLNSVKEHSAYTVKTRVYPNPFNRQVHIGYTLDGSGSVSIAIYNMYGEKVKTLLNHQKTMGSGYYETTWDGTSDNGAMLAPGIYIYTVTANNKAAASGRLVLIK